MGHIEVSFPNIFSWWQNFHDLGIECFMFDRRLVFSAVPG
jgi:hypothetical protein